MSYQALDLQSFKSLFSVVSSQELRVMDFSRLTVLPDMREQ